MDALEDIRRVKYRYARSLDLKRWDEFADVFTEDATADYGTRATSEPLTLRGREQIVSYMRDALGGNIITVHFCAQPEIEIDGDNADGDTAEGTWCFEDTVIVPDHRIMIKGSAYYEDRYRREDGVWRISHVGYQRTYELMVSFDDMPSLQLLANRWADVPQQV